MIDVAYVVVNMSSHCENDVDVVWKLSQSIPMIVGVNSVRSEMVRPSGSVTVSRMLAVPSVLT